MKKINKTKKVKHEPEIILHVDLDQKIVITKNGKFISIYWLYSNDFEGLQIGVELNHDKNELEKAIDLTNVNWSNIGSTAFRIDFPKMNPNKNFKSDGISNIS